MNKRLTFDLPNEADQNVQDTLRAQAGHLFPCEVELSLAGAQLTADLTEPLSDDEEARVRADVNQFIERTVRAFSKVRPKEIDRNVGSPSYGADPMVALQERGDITECGKGTFTFAGDALRVMQGLDAFFRAYALELGAEEHWYGQTVPARSLVQSGYLKSFPHHALLVSRIHGDIDSLTSAGKQNSGEVPAELLDDSNQILAPTVCYRCFETLRDGVVNNTKLVTATAACHRFEGAATQDLRRCQTFHMREVVYLGGGDFVQGWNTKILQDTCAYFRRWGLGFTALTATDPFFSVNNENKRSYQSLQGLKHEVQVHIPHDQSTVACASLNNHMQTLVKPFGIAADSGQLSSGCVGFGLERLTYALFAHHGLDIRSWPASVREDLAV